MEVGMQSRGAGGEASDGASSPAFRRTFFWEMQSGRVSFRWRGLAHAFRGKTGRNVTFDTNL
jgi:hypothetical protein